MRSLGQGCLLHRKLVCDIVMRWFVSNHFKLHNNCHCDVKVAVALIKYLKRKFNVYEFRLLVKIFNTYVNY